MMYETAQPLLVSYEGRGLNFFWRPPNGAALFEDLLEKPLMRACLFPPEPLRKPFTELRRRCPEWLQCLEFCFAASTTTISQTMNITIKSARFVNPKLGSGFCECDTDMIEPPIAQCCAERAIGEMMEYGQFCINESLSLPLICDCRYQIEIFIGMPSIWGDAEWEEAKRTIQDVARQYQLKPVIVGFDEPIPPKPK